MKSLIFEYKKMELPSFSAKKYKEIYNNDIDNEFLNTKEEIAFLFGFNFFIPMCKELMEKYNIYRHQIEDKYLCGEMNFKQAFYNIEQIFQNELEDNYLKEMLYEDFLKFDYWKIVAKFKKYLSRYTCKICKLKYKKLNVHHKTYKYRGLDHLYYDDKYLICVCEKCHNKLHSKKNIK